jgi:galactokinase
MELLARVKQGYEKNFGSAPEIIVRAPGRVNLIGEHTDYNDGFVMPLAIDRAIYIALSPRSGSELKVHSLDFDETVHFDLTGLAKVSDSWSEYVKGVAWALQEAGYTLSAWQGVIAGDIPKGAGLSSSAALELATARAFSAVSGFLWNPSEMALLGQKAENKWVGVNCGIMDQMISAAGEAGHALLIDCRNLRTSPVPIPDDSLVVVLDTATRRGLVGSAYNERRQQCEAAAKFFGVSALRDVRMSDFDRSGGMDHTTLRRARHVVKENTRTLRAADAMRSNDPVALGRLMNESHESMRDDFEISNEALNKMVEIAQAQPGCYGARMTGGGFGGCAVALVQKRHVDNFTEIVAQRYEAEQQLKPAIYVCEATDGAELVDEKKA